MLNLALIVSVLVIPIASNDLHVEDAATTSNSGNLNKSLQLDEYQILNIQPNEVLLLNITNIPTDISYILFQAHCQRQLLMSFSKLLGYSNHGTHVKGQDIGLVVLLNITSQYAYVYLETVDKNTTVSIYVQATGYRSNDPIPGGCNTEFDVEIAPFMILNYNIFETKVEYQRSSIGFPRSGQPQSCDLSLNSFNYDAYVYFMDEQNFTNDAYFDAVAIMSSLDLMQKKAVKIDPVSSALTFSIPTYRRIGVIFNVVVKNGNSSVMVPYVPITSYGCSLAEGEPDSCGDILSAFEWLMGIGGAIVGFFLCFFGHRFFKISMFCFGFTTLSLITFILLTRFTSLSYDDIMISMFATGFLGGFSWVVFWWFVGSPMLSVTLTGFNLGFVVASAVFFTPLGQYHIFAHDATFWVLFSCIILLIPVLLISFTQKLHIVACAVVGSYGAIVLLDRYCGGVLVYIVLNVFRRAVNASYRKVTHVVPFQTTDIILATLWVIMASLGVAFQIWREQLKPPFPIPEARLYRLRSLQTPSQSSPEAPSTSESPGPSDRHPLLGNAIHGFRKKPRGYRSFETDEDHPLPYT